MKFAIIGLSVTSSWGNGHATTYRGLLKELAALGHEIKFFEQDVPYYAKNRDLPDPAFCQLYLYQNLEELKSEYRNDISEADVVIVGSYVPIGVEVGNWVVNTAKGMTAFYDIDTPVTLAKLERKDYEYITPELIGKYDMYLSFSGGGILDFLEKNYKSPRARALYCSVDPELYFPEEKPEKWKLGYLGTYSDDRQPTLNKLLLETAKEFPEEKFVVAGPQYPETISWTKNIERIEHLPPAAHREFYNSQKFTLNVTRADMIKAGFSPSVRLFEAAACGVPIISDFWNGLDSIFKINREILVASETPDMRRLFLEIGEEERLEIAQNARQKVLLYHTAKARAKELESYVKEVLKPSFN